MPGFEAGDRRLGCGHVWLGGEIRPVGEGESVMGNVAVVGAQWGDEGKGKIVEDKCVQCPLHRARFDIRTGEVTEWANFPPGVQLLNVVRGEKALETWPVTEEDGHLFVEM